MTREPDEKKAARGAGAAERQTQERAGAKGGRENRVPRWAEDMEHTLRRIAAEKQRKRNRDPGLYG